MASILIIEDDVALLDMFGKILAHLGHDVEKAENGNSGINKFNCKTYDLVITDVVMNGKSGNCVAEHIKKSDKSRTPVIGISGTTWLADIDKFDTVIQKPFTIENLKQNVDSLLNAVYAKTEINN